MSVTFTFARMTVVVDQELVECTDEDIRSYLTRFFRRTWRFRDVHDPSPEQTAVQELKTLFPTKVQKIVPDATVMEPGRIY